MPDQSLTCAQLAAANGGKLSQTISYQTPNGSGYVLFDIDYTPDGVSVRPNCDGPITRIRTRNTSNQPMWVLLPAKKRGNPWIQVDPGTDVTTTNTTVLTNLGVSAFSDAASSEVVYTQPV